MVVSQGGCVLPFTALLDFTQETVILSLLKTPYVRNAEHIAVRLKQLYTNQKSYVVISLLYTLHLFRNKNNLFGKQDNICQNMDVSNLKKFLLHDLLQVFLLFENRNMKVTLED